MSMKGQEDLQLYVVVLRDKGRYSYYIHRINLTDLELRFGILSPSEREKMHLSFPEPILKLDAKEFLFGMGFFAAGSKIYIVGGGKPRTFSDDSQNDGGGGGSPCFVFETCPGKPNYGVVREGRRSNWGKIDPIVLGPINGKFYVTSRSLAYADLEEFDPETEYWSPLPPPPPSPLGPRLGGGGIGLGLGLDSLDFWGAYKVTRHAIAADNKRLVLITQQKGLYAYNVVSGTWEVLDGGVGGGDPLYYSGKPINFDCFWYIPRGGGDGGGGGGGGGLNYAQAQISDVNYDYWLHQVQGSELRLVDRELLNNVFACSHILSVNGESKLCMVSLGETSYVDDCPRKPLVAVDLCRLSSTRLDGFTRSNDTPLRLLEHCYATYALPHRWDMTSSIVTCLVI